MKTSVYDIVMERIFQQMEKGIIPWVKPWYTLGLSPCNLITKYEYHRINIMILSGVHKLPYYATFKQIKENGGSIKKDEKSQIIYFTKTYYKNLKTGKEIPYKEIDKYEPGEYKKIYISQYHKVWNVEQTTGLERFIPKQSETPKLEIRPLTKAIELIKNFSYKLPILSREHRAYYSPSQDIINLPKLETFKTVEDMYSTLFHEFIHSTGHKSRLNRLTESACFGSETYSYEELIAEIGGAFICGLCGIENTIENTTAYLQGWLGKLKSDKKLLIKASSQSKKAINYLLPDKPDKPEPDEPESEPDNDEPEPDKPEPDEPENIEPDEPEEPAEIPEKNNTPAISVSALKKTIPLFKNIVGKNKKNSILKNVRICADQSGAKMYGTNLGEFLAVDLDVANRREFNILVDYEKLCKVVKHTTFNNIAFSQTDDLDSAVVNVSDFDVNDYPAMPKIAGCNNKIQCGPEFFNQFRYVEKFALNDNSRRALQGIHINETNIVATDGKILAFEKHNLKVESSFIMENSKFIKAIKESVSIKTDNSNNIEISAPSWTYTGRLIESVYPTYKQVIPESFKKVFPLGKNNLEKISGLISAMKTKEAGIVNINFKTGAIKFRGNKVILDNVKNICDNDLYFSDDLLEKVISDHARANHIYINNNTKVVGFGPDASGVTSLIMPRRENCHK